MHLYNAHCLSRSVQSIATCAVPNRMRFRPWGGARVVVIDSVISVLSTQPVARRNWFCIQVILLERLQRSPRACAVHACAVAFEKLAKNIMAGKNEDVPISDADPTVVPASSIPVVLASDYANVRYC